MAKNMQNLSRYFQEGYLPPMFEHAQILRVQPPLDTQTKSTVTQTTEAISAALSYVRRSREHSAFDATLRDLSSADEFLDLALDKVDTSDRFKLLSWRIYQDMTRAKKIVITFGADLERLLGGDLHQSMIIKKYLTGNNPDTEKVVRLGKLYETLYHMRKSNPQIPHSELSAHTLKHIMSVRRGVNLAYSEEGTSTEAARKILEESYVLGEIASILPDVTDLATKEDYVGKGVRNKLRLNTYLPHREKIGRLRMWIDSRAQAREIEEDYFVPQTDPQFANIAVSDEGNRHIDLEGVISAKVTSKHLDSHVFMDPSVDMPHEDRLKAMGESGVHAAYHYLESRVATALAHGHSVPYSHWKDMARKRLQVFFDLFNVYCEILAPTYRSADLYRKFITPRMVDDVKISSFEEVDTRILEP